MFILFRSLVYMIYFGLNVLLLTYYNVMCVDIEE